METIEGMCYLHGEGVIHKDLKPENILVDGDFHIKVKPQSKDSSKIGAIFVLILHCTSFLDMVAGQEDIPHLITGGGAAEKLYQGLKRKVQT